MCSIGTVCISFTTHIMLLSLAIAGFLLLLIGMEPENKPPKNQAEELRRKWHDKMPRK